MERRILGCDLEVSAPRSTSAHLFRHRRDLRPYANEELLGEALAPFKDQVVIAAPARRHHRFSP